MLTARTRAVRGLVLTVVTTAAGAGDASAQCPDRWLPVDGVRGNNGVTAVRAITVLPASAGGGVVVGGRFSSAGGVAANNVALFDPLTNTWAAMGSGLPLPTSGSYVSSVAFVPAAGGGQLFAGVSTRALGIGVNAPTVDVYRFDQSLSTWQPVGLSGAFSVNCMLVLSDGDLLVGGTFAPALTPGGIYRYHPQMSTWTPLPGPADRSVFALAERPAGHIIAGGPFFGIGGTVGRIAQFDRTAGAWSSLDPRLQTNWVYALAAAPSGDVFVGALAGIFRYDSRTNALVSGPAGLNGLVYTMVQLPSGDLVAGGSFGLQSDPAAANLARYDFSAQRWSGLGPGLAVDLGAVYSLAVLPDGDLLVGGSFSSVINPGNIYQPAFGFARLGTAERPLACAADFNCSGTVNVLDVTDFLGRYFTGDRHADLNRDGLVSVQDLFEFMVAYFQGC